MPGMWQRACDNTASPDFYGQHWRPLLPQHENAGLRFTCWMLRLRLARSAQGLYGEDTVTKDEIIRMARESGGADISSHGWTSWVGTQSTEFLERFAKRVVALAAEREREACAKVCETEADNPSCLWEEPGCWQHAAENCAGSIRARGNT